MPISKIHVARRRPRAASVLSAAAMFAASGGFIAIGAQVASESSAAAAPVSASVKASGASCPGGAVTVTEEDYYGAASKQPTTATGIAQFMANFTKSHPCIKVVRQAPVVTGDPAYLTHVLSQFSSGSQPDLLMVDNPQLPEFAADNVLVPLSSLGTIPVVKKLNPANVAETTYKGKLYALPLYTNTIAIFYNKTLLAQNGITTLPTTWAQFAADAKKTAHGNDLGFVFSGEAGPGQATWQFDPWSWSNGATTTDASSKGAVQALNFLSSLVKDGASPKSVVTWTQTQPIQEFEAGKAAFCENGLWNIPTLQADYPKIKWGAFPVPTRVAGQTVVAPFGGEVWAITKSNPKVEKAAFQILQAMSSDIAGLARYATDVPTQESLWNEAPWNQGVYKPFIEELKHGRSRQAGIANPANEAAIDLNIGNAVEAALIGKQTASAALQAAQSQNSQLLK